MTRQPGTMLNMATEPENTVDTPVSDEAPVESAPAKSDSPAEGTPAPARAAAQEAPKPAAKKRPASPKGQAVSGGDVDTVRLSACIYKNTFARKSLSVYHVQRRLNELGYRDAYTDKTGWYGDLTKAAVAAYQAAEGLAGEGLMTADTLRSLFADDPNVFVID